MTNIGYDRYGRAQLGVKATYFTPQLSLAAIASPMRTAEKVDTDTSGSGARAGRAASTPEAQRVARNVRVPVTPGK